MPVTSQPTDQPYGQILTDEAALERVFRANYDRWIKDAKGRLGPDAAMHAPRVVSKAFHLAWQDRKRFHSMDELDAFLGANIHHGAVREQSRVAGLHRMDPTHGEHKEKHDVHEMTVDEAWTRLQQTLSGATANEAYRKRASTARHEAAEHFEQLGKDRNWKPLVAIGVIGLVLAGGAVWWIDKAGESRVVERALNAQDVRATETGSGQYADVTLDDSTVVRLSPETKLIVPKTFGMTQGLRAVKIEKGSANFNVRRAGTKPFEVRSGPAAFVATGTTFTVRRSLDDSTVIVLVREGTVELRVADQRRSVGQGGSYQVTKAGAVSVPATTELAEATSWVDGTVNLQGKTLRYVLPQMKKWWGLDVHVQDTKLLDRNVYVSAAINSQREAIASVEKSGGMKFTYIGENMAFTDTVPSKPAGKKR
jgi:ferric-dicitrate binding protein FerR (iron transport regulator)